MSSHRSSTFAHYEIANLAYLSWQKDGCPHGRDEAYWLEAEHQIKHTKHLLIEENRSQPTGKTSQARPKARRKKAATA